MANTVIYQEDWAATVQEHLDEPTIWKDICTVDISNKRVVHNPYRTDATVQTGTRETAYTFQDDTITDESVTINTYKILPQVIDRADLAQTDYLDQMQLAARQGTLLSEDIGTAIFADHANMTDFGTSSIGGGGAATDQITVSATNIDDIIRGLRRVIRVAEGETMLNRNGGFIVWRAADLEILEAFMQANGFSTADTALTGGSRQAMNYMGFTHYSSELLAANHLMAGVKKAPWIGIVRDTFGQIMVDDKDPNLVSGVSVVSRVDYKEKIWTNVKPVIFDINVA
ncbi:hypothetical protein CMI37_10470 [Candidatus Pacearchaeota archaeon]|nr:hypothetical protein [Candidatus Pacearchaeota archaeon]